jgi:hypothetical protein
VSAANKTHGRTKSPEYGSWRAIVTRCTKPTAQQFRDYGGRGITICDRWRASFEDFLADMGERPGPGYSVEREDNDGPYSPDNCRWATAKEQVRNRRNTHFLTLNGVTKSLQEWAEELGISARTLYTRIFAYGWPVERALVEQVKVRNVSPS